MRACCTLALLLLCIGCEQGDADRPTPAVPSKADGPKTTASTKLDRVSAPASGTRHGGDRFACPTPDKGMDRTRTYERTGTFELRRGDEVEPFRNSERAVVRERVLTVDPRGVSALEVTFAEHDTPSGSGTPNLREKTFRIERQSIAMAAGTKASQRQQRFLRGLYGNLDSVLLPVPERSLRPGQAVPELVEHFRELFEAGESPFRIRQLSVTYKGKDGDRARFEVELDASIRRERGEIGYKLAGPVVMRASDCMPLEIKLEGTAAAAGGMPMSGSFLMSEQYEYGADRDE